MLSTIVAVLFLQAMSLASATIANAPFPEMAMAVNDPANYLVAPKRSSPQAANPDFISSDSTYWLVDYTYSGASCTSNVVLKFGVATGYCFQTGGSSSLMYACTSGLFMIHEPHFPLALTFILSPFAGSVFLYRDDL